MQKGFKKTDYALMNQCLYEAKARELVHGDDRILLASRSPSPRPSPLGRGRIIRRHSRKRAIEFFENRMTGFAGRASEKQGTCVCCSLSPREWVRVRENKTHKYAGFTFALVEDSIHFFYA